MQDLNITTIQSSIHWQNPGDNLRMFDQKINNIKNNTDIILLPEMFNAGFVTKPSECAEKMDGASISWLKNKAFEKKCVIAGSLLIEENGKYFNRFVWMNPDESFSCYDKKHLFRFAGEHLNFTAGENKLIMTLNGWKIFPVICYDLRFPVWCRNNYLKSRGYDFDLMVVVANWPSSRIHAWNTLLMARAIENICYVAGVNRVGKDGNDIDYNGYSAVISPMGEKIASCKPGKEQVNSQLLSGNELDSFRETFKVAEDWDKFTLNDI